MTEVWRLLLIQRHKLRFAKLEPVYFFLFFGTLKPVGKSQTEWIYARPMFSLLGFTLWSEYERKLIGDYDWYEVKAKNGKIYTSTSTGQLSGELTALHNEVSGVATTKKGGYKVVGGLANFNIVTTSGVELANNLYQVSNRIAIHHFTSQYRMTAGGQMEIRFMIRGQVAGGGIPVILQLH